MRPALSVWLVATTCVWSGIAAAHVELQPQSAPAGGDFRAVFGVEHGCAGAATTAIRIRLDDRIVSARPMAKPGWTVQVTRATVKQADGSSLQEPREIAFTGGNIPGDFYDEFVMLVALPDAAPGSVLYFPVVQECGKTTVRWIEMPVTGEDPETLDYPAPSVTLTPGTSSPHAAGEAH